MNIAGWSSLEARRAHNPKVIGSNPVPATQRLIKDFLYKSFAQIAQLVEQRTENPRVTGSIPVLGIFFIRFSLNLLYNDKQSTAKFFAYSIFLLWIEQMTSVRFILDVR